MSDGDEEEAQGDVGMIQAQHHPPRSAVGGGAGRSKQLRGTLALALLTLLFNYGGWKLPETPNSRGLLESNEGLGGGGGGGVGGGGRS